MDNNNVHSMDGQSNDKSDIVQFYSGKSILITGATGFMGKVMVEKFLRDCPSIKEIYILVRTKRGVDAQQRCEEYVEDIIFDYIRANYSTQLNKIHLIKGDVTVDKLGLSDEDEIKLIDNLNVIFHCAAKAKFSLSLKEALNFNTCGTLRVLQLAEKLKNLEVFHHVSTAYCHCQVMELEERRFETREDPYEILKLMDDRIDELEAMKSKIMEYYPNTYALSKSYAEELVHSYRKKFPVVISRPSVVISAWKLPYPGWIEGYKNGMVGCAIAQGRGALRTMLVNGDLPVEIMPVDITCNAIIAMTYQRTLIKNDDVFVCNLTNSRTISWSTQKYFNFTHKISLKYPFDKLLFYPNCALTKNLYLNRVQTFFYHSVPAVLADTFLLIIGQKPKMMYINTRLNKALNTFSYYNTRDYSYKNDNFKQISNNMNEKDKELFYCDFKKVDMEHLVTDFILGIRKYVLGMSDESLDLRRGLLNFMWHINNFVNIVLGLAVFVLLMIAYYSIFEKGAGSQFLDEAADNIKTLLSRAPLVKQFRGT